MNINNLLNHFGTQGEIASAINKSFGENLTQQAVSKWFVSGVIPPKRAVQIEKLSGGAFKRNEMRPDIFE